VVCVWPRLGRAGYTVNTLVRVCVRERDSAACMRAEAEAEGVCNGLVRRLGGACVCVCVCVCVQCSAAQRSAAQCRRPGLRFNSAAGFACLAVVQARVAGRGSTGRRR
jgi:hypothetical protein